MFGKIGSLRVFKNIAIKAPFKISFRINHFVSIFFSRSIFEKRTAMSMLSDAFEVWATQYLNNWVISRIPNVKFFHAGGKSAWESDIKVLFYNKTLFCISAKLRNPQGGQITLIKNKTGIYEVSPKSHKPVKDNTITPKIVQHLNDNPSIYSNPTEASINFMDNDIIIEWFKEQSIEKDERFIVFPMDETPCSDCLIITPCKVDLSFDIWGSFRIKRTGSNHVPMCDNPTEIISIATKHLLDSNFIVKSVYKKSKHTYLSLSKSLPKSPTAKIRYFHNQNFLLSPSGCDDKLHCRVVKRGKIVNPNVMVEMKAKDSSCIINNGLLLLEKEIKNEIRGLSC